MSEAVGGKLLILIPAYNEAARLAAS